MEYISPLKFFLYKIGYPAKKMLFIVRESTCPLLGKFLLLLSYPESIVLDEF
jgi:hypothetical protein